MDKIERSYPEPSVKVYTVREGDTLSAIARKMTGSADYRAIYEQNKSTIGDSPNKITAGMALIIPA